MFNFINNPKTFGLFTHLNFNVISDCKPISLTCVYSCAILFSCHLEQLFSHPGEEKTTKSCKTEVQMDVHHIRVEMGTIQDIFHQSFVQQS